MSYPHQALFDLAAGRALPPVENLQLLLTSVVEHRMEGLLWSRVDAGELNGDRDWQTMLAARSLQTEARNRYLWQSLKEVVEVLGSIGVEVATFKGVIAEARWYDRMGERPVRDIDLLVAPHHQNRIGDIIDILQPDHPLRESAQSLFDSGDLQSIDLRFKSDAWIDLHTDVLKLFVPGRQQQTIWDRTVSFSLPGGNTIRVLDTETSLIQFLVHLNKDRFAFLLGFADVAHILQREELDWDFIDRFAQAEGLEPVIYSSLQVVTGALDLKGSFPRPPTGWRSATWQLIWRPSVRLRGRHGIATGRARQAWIPYLTLGRGIEAFRRWVRRLFPRADLLSYYYPDLRGPYMLKLLRGRLGTQIRRRRQSLQ